ncbi:uncharacterized protein LOC118435689 [Folsomia candida]|nr:uncharacterized protein LOC118435689 [Folsomia candida]
MDISRLPRVSYLKSIDVKDCDGHQIQFLNKLCELLILASSTTLETLNISWNKKQNFNFIQGAIFPKLTQLWTHTTYRNRIFTIENFGQAITESVPNLRFLSTRCDQLVSVSGMLSRFPLSLSRLHLYGGLSIEFLECLLEIPSNLNDIYLDGPLEYAKRVEELSKFLYKFLKKYSTTLEKITINAFNEGIELEWRFPVFPVLKSFKIFGGMNLTKSFFETSLGSRYFGGIDYNVNFPVLEILLISTSWHELPYVAAFLPPPEDNCQEYLVRDVHFTLTGPGWTPGKKLVQTELCKRLLKIFPKARDSLMGDLVKFSERCAQD